MMIEYAMARPSSGRPFSKLVWVEIAHVLTPKASVLAQSCERYGQSLQRAANQNRSGIAVGDGTTISGNSAVTIGGDGIETGSGSAVKGNTLRSNTGCALNLLGSSLTGYRANVSSGAWHRRHHGVGCIGARHRITILPRACP